jgi:transcriptional regulator with XRE-family HTH domain
MKEQISDLATKVNALMLKKGLTRKELAAEVGVSAQFFIHLADGQMPAADKFCKLANALGVSAEWLLYGHDIHVPSWTFDLTTIFSRLDETDKDAIIAFAEFYQEQKDKFKTLNKSNDLDLVIAFSEFLKNRKTGRFGVVIQRYQDRLQKLKEEHEKPK